MKMVYTATCRRSSYVIIPQKLPYQLLYAYLQKFLKLKLSSLGIKVSSLVYAQKTSLFTAYITL